MSENTKRCNRHAQSKASYACSSCLTFWCDTCILSGPLNPDGKRWCPRCNGLLQGLDSKPKPPPPQTPRSFELTPEQRRAIPYVVGAVMLIALIAYISLLMDVSEVVSPSKDGPPSWMSPDCQAFYRDSSSDSIAEMNQTLIDKTRAIASEHVTSTTTYIRMGLGPNLIRASVTEHARVTALTLTDAHLQELVADYGEALLEKPPLIKPIVHVAHMADSKDIPIDKDDTLRLVHALEDAVSVESAAYEAIQAHCNANRP